MSEKSVRDTRSPENSLPDGWRWVPLGHVCSIVARQVNPRQPEYAELPHVSPEDIESGRCVLRPLKTAQEDGMVSGKYLFEEGDVLYSKLRPYLRKVAVANCRGVCSADMYPLRPKPDFAIAEYLAWLLVGDEFTRYAEAESRRARMPKINRDQLLAWKAAFPPIEEQRRIAAMLREQMAAVDRARVAGEARLEAAKALSTAYLRSLFEGREAQEWPKRLLGEVAEIESGVTLGRKLRAGSTRAVPYLRVANVKDGALDLSNVYSIEATTAEIGRLVLKRGDLLLTEGGDRDKLGRGTFWEEQLPECIHQNHIFRVRFDLTNFSSEFVSAQIGSRYGKAYFLAHAKQTTGIATINRKVLSGFPLMLPPLREQQRIAAIVRERVDRAGGVCAAAEAELAAINALPAALLRRAFSGAL